MPFDYYSRNFVDARLGSDLAPNAAERRATLGVELTTRTEQRAMAHLALRHTPTRTGNPW